MDFTDHTTTPVPGFAEAPDPHADPLDGLLRQIIGFDGQNGGVGACLRTPNQVIEQTGSVARTDR